MIRYDISHNSTFLNEDSIKITYSQSKGVFNENSKGYFEFKEDVDETIFKAINSELVAPRVDVITDIEYDHNAIHSKIIIHTDANNRLVHGYKVFWGQNSYLGSSNIINTSTYNQRDDSMSFLVDISGNLSGNFIEGLQIPSHEEGSQFDVSRNGTQAPDLSGELKDTIYCSLDADNNIVIRFDRTKIPVDKTHIYVKAVNRQQLVWRPWDTDAATYDVAAYDRELELNGHRGVNGEYVEPSFDPRYLESKIRSVPIVDQFAANVQSARFIYRHREKSLKNSKISIAIPIDTLVEVDGVMQNVGNDDEDGIEEGRVYSKTGGGAVTYLEDYGPGVSGKDTLVYKFYWAKKEIPRFDRHHNETTDEWGHAIPPSEDHNLVDIHQHTYYYSSQRDHITTVKANHTHFIYTFGQQETDAELVLPTDADGLVVEMCYDADGRHHTQTFIPFDVLSARPLVKDANVNIVNRNGNVVDITVDIDISQNNYSNVEVSKPKRYVIFLAHKDRTVYMREPINAASGLPHDEPALIGEVAADKDNEVVKLITTKNSIDLTETPFLLLMGDYGDHLQDEYVEYDLRDYVEFSAELIFDAIHNDSSGISENKIIGSKYVGRCLKYIAGYRGNLFKHKAILDLLGKR